VYVSRHGLADNKNVEYWRINEKKKTQTQERNKRMRGKKK
jgi:hypothetical protein